MSKTLYFSNLDRKIFALSKIYPFTYVGLAKRTIPKNTQSLLDMGCGNGEFMKLLVSGRRLIIDGVEIFSPYIRDARNLGIYERIYQTNILEFVPTRKYDVVFLAHVLEHFNKNDGWKLLQKLSSFTKKRIVVIIPNGEYEQEAYDGNPFQQHKSAWKVKDLQKQGFTVNGQGWKFLYKNKHAHKLGYLFYLLYVFSTLTQPLLRIFPNQALQLICVKDV